MSDKKQSQMDAEERSERRRQAQVRRHKARRRKLTVILTAFFLAFLVAGGAAIYRSWVVPADASNTSTVEVEIPAGTTVEDMGRILKREGVIRSANAFELYVKARGVAPNIQAGVHELSPSMAMDDIVDELQASARENTVARIVVTEGQTVEDIADTVGEKTKHSADEFLELMKDQDYLNELVNDYPFLEETVQSDAVRYALEGYLFPATYDFDTRGDLKGLVKQMLDKTQSVLAGYQEAIDASGYSVNQIMTLASLVEKEGTNAENRAKIAAVFYNRLNQSMPLQSDISVLYALGKHKEYVSFNDLSVESPYNLYQNKGLAPGPMSNPGEEAIKATVEPDQNDYLYFIANMQTGEIFFTDSYEQHTAWQKEYEETGKISG